MRFDPADGSKPTQSTVKTGTLAAPPQQNPQRDGFRFDGWTYDNQPFDFQTPILQDMTMKAQWSKTADWTLSPDHGPAFGARLTIKPPSPQEPCYVNVHAAGNQFLGLTGDGRIYTWAQDGTPKKVHAPVQAPNGFHYLQAADGSHLQAALGSDQHIYTWNSGQATPTILNTSQSTRFTSISMNDDLLLAVDQQGQVHTFQDSQNPNLKTAEQGTISLPEQAQAVTTVASDNQILALDSVGQAWTWGTTNTGNTKPERLTQNPHTRTVQTQALSQGFLLLDGDGQTHYLANNKTTTSLVSLPGGARVTRITVNKNQAMITSNDGNIWSWKPGVTPMRADKGEQAYTEAASTEGRITALDRQGNIFTWSLDAQGNPGRPVRIATASIPILESADVDKQLLKLTKKNNAWQANIPARKPGPATITITGRQNHKLFSKSLDYTVDQPLTRDAKTSTSHTVHFNSAGGSPGLGEQTIFYPFGRVQRPSPNPTREGYQFDGWFIGEVAYDFSKPVSKDLTLTAKWTPENPSNSWSINPDKGSQLGGQQTTIIPPNGTSDIKFTQVSSSRHSTGFSLAIGSDGNAYAWGYDGNGELGDGIKTEWSIPVSVLKPKSVSPDFTYVQVSAGGDHSLALGSDGYVYAWGSNQYGQLGNNSTESSSVPVRVRDPSSPTDASKGLKAIQVSAGEYHSLAIDEKGNAWAWGLNLYGQLGNGTTTSQDIDIPVPVEKPSGVRADFAYSQISGGGYYSLAIDSDGNTWAWGLNLYGQLGNTANSGTYNQNSVPIPVLLDPNDTSTGLKAMQVSAGNGHALAIDQNGNARAWGSNYNGQIGNNINIGTNNPNPVPQKVLLNPKKANTGLQAVEISGGSDHSLAIDKDGNTWAWGYNMNGQLGNNTTIDQHSPVRVLSATQSANSANNWLNSIQISAGASHSLAIDKDGNAWAWGDNQYGQLCTGTANINWDKNPVPRTIAFDLQPRITSVTFDETDAIELTHDNGNSVTVTTPAHAPGTVTVSVDYTLGGTPQTPDTSLRYTYLPAGVLPRAGGEGILLALATGMTGMGGVLASRRHRREQHQLSQASHE